MKIDKSFVYIIKNAEERESILKDISDQGIILSSKYFIPENWYPYAINLNIESWTEWKGKNNYTWSDGNVYPVIEYSDSLLNQIYELW